MGGYAWVTLATNDAYSLGALVLAHSLRRVGSKYEMAILITPGVKQEMRDKLAGVFGVVQEVNVLDSNDKANLALLKRPELGVTFTKLHCWRLTQFEKCVFLDADTLVVRNCDELFEREELSAAPDVGWPDCFNSGVFVFKPSEETFTSVLKLATEKGSFDGGDQGVLNLYFSDWAHKDISKHLPFVYNMCSTAVYSYLPAFKQFGEDVRIIHFIGETKPWLQYFDTLTGIVRPPPNNAHLQPLLQMWWNIFCDNVYTQLSSSMDPSIPASNWHDSVSPPTQSDHPDVDVPIDFSEFSDPWLDYDRETDPFIQPAYQEQYYSPEPDVEQVYESVTEQFVVLDSSNFQIDVESLESQSTTVETETEVEEETNEQSRDISDFDICDLSSSETRVFSESISSDTKDSSPISSPTQNPQFSVLFQSLETNSSHFESLPQSEHGGLAGALATMTLGEPRTSEQSALEEHMRKQSWEYGNIDYLGRDSFDNIWKKIGETLAEKPAPIQEEPAEKEASSKVVEKEEISSKSVESQPETTPAEETPIGLEQKMQSEPSSQSTEPVSQPPSTPQQELPPPLVPSPLLETKESEPLVCPISTGPSKEDPKPDPKDLFEPLSYALTPAELESQLASTTISQPIEEKQEPISKAVTEVSHTAIMIQQAVPTPEAQIEIEQIPQTPTEPQKVVSKTEIQLVPSSPVLPPPELPTPPVEPATPVVAAEIAVPLQVAESVLQPELKESGEALSSTVAPVQESAAAISESTILESVPAPIIEQNTAAIQPSAPSNGFVEPSTLAAFSAPVTEAPRPETSPPVVPPVVPLAVQVPSAEPPKVEAVQPPAEAPKEEPQPKSEPVPVAESIPVAEPVPVAEPEQVQAVQPPVTQVEQKVEEKPEEGKKLELKISQPSEPEPKLEIPSTPTVTGPTPPISPPALAESEGPQEESKEKSPEEKKKKIVSKGSVEGEEGEGSKKTVKKVVKKVVKKRDSTEEAGEGSSTKKTTKTVKKVSKSPQQSLEADDSVPQTPPPASSEPPVAPKRKAKSTKTTVDKKTEDPK